MVTILREADEKPVPEVAKKHGISADDLRLTEAFRQPEPTDVKRLHSLSKKRSAEEADGRARARSAQGDHAKKW